jgi:hypothetical protein
LYFELDCVEGGLQEMNLAPVASDHQLAVLPLGVGASADLEFEGELFEDVIVSWRTWRVSVSSFGRPPSIFLVIRCQKTMHDSCRQSLNGSYHIHRMQKCVQYDPVCLAVPHPSFHG